MEFFQSYFFAFTLLSVTTCATSYNILIALPVESESIHHFYSKLSMHLVEANHSVTLVTSYNASFFHPNFRHVNLMAGNKMMEFNVFESTGIVDAILETGSYLDFISSVMWSNEEVLDLWDKRNTFDVFITAAYANEAAMPFLMNFTGQFVLISNPGLEYFSTAFLGNWLPPSVASLLLLPFDENMSFFERVVNVLLLPIFYQAHTKYSINLGLSNLKRKFPELEDFQTYYGRASLTLINGVSTLDGAMPLLPNQVEIGTLNARPAQPLPEDLEEFISSSAEHGLIYFSLGSIARSVDIPVRAKLEFVEAFRRLPQKVLWKYEEEDLDVPDNVMIRAWLPQQDVLGHPKTRVFITQGGIMSIQELQYHGVPALLVPIIFDQYRNAARLVRKDLGLQLDWDTLTADEIVESINTLVNDTSYGERLRTLSAVLRDQPERPSQRAVWWIEYVVRHRGAPHLQYPGKRLHFLQYICADVIFCLTACLYGLYVLAKTLVRALRAACSRARRGSKQKSA